VTDFYSFSVKMIPAGERHRLLSRCTDEPFGCEALYGHEAAGQKLLFWFRTSRQASGGRRLWFWCPGCGGRCGILFVAYHHAGATQRRCRGCLNLAYPAEFKNRNAVFEAVGRPAAKLEKLRRRRQDRPLCRTGAVARADLQGEREEEELEQSVRRGHAELLERAVISMEQGHQDLRPLLSVLEAGAIASAVVGVERPSSSAAPPDRQRREAEPGDEVTSVGGHRTRRPNIARKAHFDFEQQIVARMDPEDRADFTREQLFRGDDRALEVRCGLPHERFILYLLESGVDKKDVEDELQHRALLLGPPGYVKHLRATLSSTSYMPCSTTRPRGAVPPGVLDAEGDIEVRHRPSAAPSPDAEALLLRPTLRREIELLLLARQSPADIVSRVGEKFGLRLGASVVAEYAHFFFDWAKVADFEMGALQGLYQDAELRRGAAFGGVAELDRLRGREVVPHAEKMIQDATKLVHARMLALKKAPPTPENMKSMNSMFRSMMLGVALQQRLGIDAQFDVENVKSAVAAMQQGTEDLSSAGRGTAGRHQRARSPEPAAGDESLDAVHAAAGDVEVLARAIA